MRSVCVTLASAEVSKPKLFGVLGVLVGLVIYPMHRLLIGEHDQTGMALVRQTLHAPMFWTAVAVGLLAQSIDGGLGTA